MKHGLRARGIVAPLLALAASSASATPAMKSGESAAPTASLTGRVPADLPPDRSAETKIPSGPETRSRTKIASQASPASGRSVRPRLEKLVRDHGANEARDAEQRCLAGAVYFEARGEPLEGQLAVAEVVLNRAASGEYPASICEVVTQPAQFSFVRNGLVPPIDESSAAWRTALAVAHIADEKLARELQPNVLWYHADYVQPSWGRRLAAVTQIGAHIFYRRA